MIPIPALSVKDYIIAGLSALLLALCVMCFVSISLPLGLRIEGWRPYGERMKTERDAANERLKVSNTSIASLKASVSAQNADIEKRAVAYQDSLKHAEIDAERLEKAAMVSQAQIDRLKALSVAKGNGKCEVPAELSDALSGL